MKYSYAMMRKHIISTLSRFTAMFRSPNCRGEQQCARQSTVQARATHFNYCMERYASKKDGCNLHGRHFEPLQRCDESSFACVANFSHFYEAVLMRSSLPSKMCTGSVQALIIFNGMSAMKRCSKYDIPPPYDYWRAISHWAHVSSNSIWIPSNEQNSIFAAVLLASFLCGSEIVPNY